MSDMRLSIKIKKKYLGVSLFLIIVIVFIYLGINKVNLTEKWDILDNYDNLIKKCSLDSSTYANSGNYNSLDVQLKSCRVYINNILLDINEWRRDDPNNRDWVVAELDYEAMGAELDMFNAVIRYKMGNSGVSSFNIIDLLNRYIDKTNKIKNQYSDTKYYIRYYKPKIEDINNEIQFAEQLKKEWQNTANTYN